MHRVYVREHGEVWTLASVYVQRGPLPTCPDDYVVYETERPPSVQQVCLLTEGGLRLCDVGPMHTHGD